MSHFNHDSSREQQRLRHMLRQAMQNCDELVVEFDYEDAKGNSSRRVVSPIRFVGADRMLGLCLSREEPRQFCLSRCRGVSVRAANDYVMPVPMSEPQLATPSHEPAELPTSG
jgi:predicted DNA-binding transcriptional regulator YafY